MKYESFDRKDEDENSQEEDEVHIRGTTPPRKESDGILQEDGDVNGESNLPPLNMCDSWEKVDIKKSEMEIIKQGSRLQKDEDSIDVIGGSNMIAEVSKSKV